MTGVPALFTRHRGLARSIADGYYWPGAEKQDIRQEAEIGLWIACRDWSPDGGANFKSFALLIIRRRLATVLRTALLPRHELLNRAVRQVVDPDTGDPIPLVELLPGGPDTAEVVIARDQLDRIVAAIATLSQLERQALTRVVNGEPYAGDKSVDNAVVRARVKLRKAAA